MENAVMADEPKNRPSLSADPKTEKQSGRQPEPEPKPEPAFGLDANFDQASEPEPALELDADFDQATGPEVLQRTGAMEITTLGARDRVRDPFREANYRQVEALAHTIATSFSDAWLRDLLREGPLSLRCEILICGAVPDFGATDPRGRTAWTAIARAMTILAPNHHRTDRKFGEALALSRISETRVARIADAPTIETASDEVVRAARLLRDTGTGGFDFRPVAHDLLAAEKTRSLKGLMQDYLATPEVGVLTGANPEEDWEDWL